MPQSIPDRRLVLAAAARFEAEPAIHVLRHQEIPFTFLEVGIGAVASARRAASLTPLISRRRVVFIGSCGSSDEFAAPFLVAPQRVVWQPVDVRKGYSYLVDHAEPPIDLNPSDWLKTLKPVDVCSSSSISLTLEGRGGVYENLELYSVSSAWASRCEFQAILGVTNQIGPNAKAEWRAHFRTVSELTARYLESVVDRIRAD